MYIKESSLQEKIISACEAGDNRMERMRNMEITGEPM
jgi:hypothetical protein